MIVEHLTSSSWKSLLGVLLAYFLSILARNRFGGGLNKVPGPFLAGWTDLWRLYVVWTRQPQVVHIDLHKKYGSIVRLGPRSVSVGDPDAAKVIYALNAGFVKVILLPRFKSSVRLESEHCV